MEIKNSSETWAIHVKDSKTNSPNYVSDWKDDRYTYIIHEKECIFFEVEEKTPEHASIHLLLSSKVIWANSLSVVLKIIWYANSISSLIGLVCLVIQWEEN